MVELGWYKPLNWVMGGCARLMLLEHQTARGRTTFKFITHGLKERRHGKRLRSIEMERSPLWGDKATAYIWWDVPRKVYRKSYRAAFRHCYYTPSSSFTLRPSTCALLELSSHSLQLSLLFTSVFNLSKISSPAAFQSCVSYLS